MLRDQRVQLFQMLFKKAFRHRRKNPKIKIFTFENGQTPGSPSRRRGQPEISPGFCITETYELKYIIHWPVTYAQFVFSRGKYGQNGRWNRKIMKKYAANGHLDAIDTLALTAQKLYKDINYSTESKRIRSNLLLMNAALAPI